MKRLSTFMGKLALLMLGVCFFAACSDDDGPSYSTASVQNGELKAILTQKGYSFNEQGNILLDDLANNTTELDLSGTKISQSALSELTILPKLTDVNLSNNNYGPVFHVDSLPSQITGLDLRGNEIYDFEGLVNANVVNDEVVATILHPFTKLYLPASSKYNVEDLMPFYTQNQADGKTVDMKMVDDNGSLSAYNTSREIPDQYFRAYLKNVYPSIFEGDKVDISKPLGVMEKGAVINLWAANQYSDIDKIRSIEGVEYFVNNPYFDTFYVSIGYGENKFDVKALMPRQNITNLSLINTEIAYLDLSKASNVSHVEFSNNSLKSLDLSNTLVANQKLEDFTTVGNVLKCYDCPNMQEIILANEGEGIINQLQLCNLPMLKSIDLGIIKAFAALYLFLDGCQNVTYPHFQSIYRNGKLVDFSSGRTANFGISENVYNISSTKDFINSYSDYMRVNSPSGYNSYSWK